MYQYDGTEYTQSLKDDHQKRLIREAMTPRPLTEAQKSDAEQVRLRAERYMQRKREARATK